MTRNVGSLDRFGRVVAALTLGVAAALAPFGLAVRLGLFAAPALMMLGTAMFGACPGYSLLGLSTCPSRRSQT